MQCRALVCLHAAVPRGACIRRCADNACKFSGLITRTLRASYWQGTWRSMGASKDPRGCQDSRSHWQYGVHGKGITVHPITVHPKRPQRRASKVLRRKLSYDTRAKTSIASSYTVLPSLSCALALSLSSCTSHRCKARGFMHKNFSPNETCRLCMCHALIFFGKAKPFYVQT